MEMLECGAKKHVAILYDAGPITGGLRHRHVAAARGIAETEHSLVQMGSVQR